MALDRRARAEIVPVPSDFSVVQAPGYASASGRFRSDDGVVEWLEGGAEFGLVEHVWREAGTDLAGNWSIRLDTTAFSDAASGRKLGIGSSAALAVALAGACCAAAGRDAQSTEAALAAHRRFQQGFGSGVDVACSATGGLIVYSMDGSRAERLSWPDGLHLGIAWVGVAANTRERLERLRRQEPRPSRTALATASRRMTAAWLSGEPQAVVEELRNYCNALNDFSVDHGLGIFDAGHAELSRMADGTGVVYKPCGAGGGDVGMALAIDPGEIEQFFKLAGSMNICRVDAQLDNQGLLVSRRGG
jgi:phosphomevalonate kinase